MRRALFVIAAGLAVVGFLGCNPHGVPPGQIKRQTTPGHTKTPPPGHTQPPGKNK